LEIYLNVLTKHGPLNDKRKGSNLLAFSARGLIAMNLY